MTSALNKTKQLNRLKTLRKTVAERKMLKARADVVRCEQHLEHSMANLEAVRGSAYAVRTKRLEALFGAETEHGVHHSLAVNTYFQTDEEIEIAKGIVEASDMARLEAVERLKLAQHKLAQKMRQEKKAELVHEHQWNEERRELSRQG